MKKMTIASAYKPGQVSALLFADGKKNKTEGKNDSLAKLFSSPQPLFQTNKQLTTSPTSLSMPLETLKTASEKTSEPQSETKKKKKKKDKKGSETMTQDKKKPVEKSPLSAFPYTHETLLQKSPQTSDKKAGMKRKLEKDKQDDDDDTLSKRPRRDRKREKTADNRTIFVGNCPLTADKKRLKKLFREYGEIESIRFRCAPPAELSLPKRAIVITKNFHERCTNYVAYIVFKEEAAAKNALKKNGFALDDLHLRVDLASLSRKHDKKRSIFVGNLPFAISEEMIRSHFEDCGDITNIRIVRDRSTSLGKGICYVQFESKDSVNLALKLNNSELQGRQLRVMVCINKPKKTATDKQGKGKKVKKKDGSDKPVKRKPTFAPSNVSGMSFKTLLKTRKEKQFRKKKKKNAKKTNELSAIFGNAPAKKAKLGKAKKTNKKGKQAKKKSFDGAKRKPFQKGSTFKGKGRGGSKKIY